MTTPGPIKTSRIEAFSDGVIAIILTIMVLELKVPDHVGTLGHGMLVELLPKLVPYVLSFLMIAIMWVNHHELLNSALRAGYAVMWANNHLLFWMSLIPIVTAYLGDHPFHPLPLANYGFVLTGTSIAFSLLRLSVTRNEQGTLSARDSAEFRKSLIVAAVYGASIPLAFVSAYLPMAIFIAVPALYFLPYTFSPASTGAARE